MQVYRTRRLSSSYCSFRCQAFNRSIDDPLQSRENYQSSDLPANRDQSEGLCSDVKGSEHAEKICCVTRLACAALKTGD